MYTEDMEIWIDKDMDFKKTSNSKTTITVKWSKNFFEDYKKLSYQFRNCGVCVFNDIIDGCNIIAKMDYWFLVVIYLFRQSIELGLKALVFREYDNKNRPCEDIVNKCKHNLSMLLEEYIDASWGGYFTSEEEDWITKYFESLESKDQNSDTFRFPFKDPFLLNFGYGERNSSKKFIDLLLTGYNLLQAFNLVKKCLEDGNVEEGDEFDASYAPIFCLSLKMPMWNVICGSLIWDHAISQKL
ncbi:MAG: hypothetical protein NC299_00330 [Lachnospiraceae bacterium]|nr:hypothetical protein [Ruminococcus sp.]MCM1273792.1 hypothetical protein [Lachnospiraceae bacterium]